MAQDKDGGNHFVGTLCAFQQNKPAGPKYTDDQFYIGQPSEDALRSETSTATSAQRRCETSQKVSCSLKVATVEYSLVLSAHK